jgi:hypothetical protein
VSQYLTLSLFVLQPSQQVAASMEAKSFLVELVLQADGEGEVEGEGDKDGGGGAGKKDKAGSNGGGGSKGKGSGSGLGMLRRGSKSSATPQRIRGQVTRLVCAEEEGHTVDTVKQSPRPTKDKGKERESSGEREVATSASLSGENGTKSGSSSPRAVSPRRKASHMFVASYTPAVAGRYRLIVSYDGEDMTQCPVRVTVTEGTHEH